MSGTRRALVGGAGEQLEAELNRAGPGTCKFVLCDVSKEADLKVRVCACESVGSRWLVCDSLFLPYFDFFY